jgi:hypothetical protein
MLNDKDKTHDALVADWEVAGHTAIERRQAAWFTPPTSAATTTS